MTAASVLTVHPVPGSGTEDVVLGRAGADAGMVLTGTEDGAIWRMSPDGARFERVASTGGRPLGLELDVDDRLLVCDARRGLLRVDTRTGGVEPVLAEVDGQPLTFCNNAAVDADGTVYFTDSSRRFGIEAWKEEMVQDTATGRLIRLDSDGGVTTLLDGLRFANGVALVDAGERGRFVAVAETAARTVVRRWLSGPRAGEQDLLVADLPGYPDNLSTGTDGLVWVALASPTDPLVGRLQRAPLTLRRLATRFPDALQPKPGRTVRVQAYDGGGALVHDLDLHPAGDGPGFHMVTGVREHEGRVWLGSLHEAAVAVVDLT